MPAHAVIWLDTSAPEVEFGRPFRAADGSLVVPFVVTPDTVAMETELRVVGGPVVPTVVNLPAGTVTARSMPYDEAALQLVAIPRDDVDNSITVVYSFLLATILVDLSISVVPVVQTVLEYGPAIDVNVDYKPAVDASVDTQAILGSAMRVRRDRGG